MAKNKITSKYVCSECGAVTPGWLGRCPSCGKFGTINEEIEETVTVTEKSSRKPTYEKPVPLSEVEHEQLTRIDSGIDELNTVLGGGIVPSSLVLIGGDPGIGK